MCMRLIKLLLILFLPSLASADDWNWAPDQPVGSTLPDFTVAATDGSSVTLGELAGTRGTLLFFSRSTDW